MADKDILFTAGLEEKDVFDTLNRIQKRVDQMVTHSDKRMQRMGTGFATAVKKWEGSLKSFYDDFERRRTDDLLPQLSPAVIKSFRDLVKTVKEMEAPLDAAVKRMQQLEPIKLVDFETGETAAMPRVDFRDSILREIASIRGDILREKLEEIVVQGQGVVSAAAVGMRSDLIKAFQDSSMMGKDLLSTVTELESGFKRLGAAALSYELIPTGTGAEVTREQGRDIAQGIFSEERGREVLARIEAFLEQAQGRVRSGAQILANDLRSLLDKGAKEIGGEQFGKEINAIASQFNALSGVKPLDLITEQEINDVDRLYIAYKRSTQIFSQVMTQGDQTARAYAQRINERIKAEYLAGLAGEQSAKQATAGVKNYLAVLRELTQFKPEDRDPIEGMLAEIDINSLRNRMFKLMDGGNEVIKEYASKFRDELTKMLADPPSADQVTTRLKEIESQLDDVIQKTLEGQQVSAQGPGVGVSGRRVDLGEAFDVGAAERKRDQLIRLTEEMMLSADEVVKRNAAGIKAQLEAMFIVPGESKQFTSELKNLEGQLKELQGVRPLEFLRTEQAAMVQQYTGELEKAERAVKQLEETGTEADKAKVNNSMQVIRATRSLIDQQSKLSKAEQTSLKKSHSAIKAQLKAIEERKKAEKELIELQQEQAEAADAIGQAQKKADIDVAYRRLNDILKRSQTLLNSTNTNARAAGQALRDAAIKGKDSLDQSDDSLEEVNKELERMERLSRDTGRALGENISGGANRATASLWKMGNALDRVGVRGVGGIVRVVDAFAGLGPVAIGAAVAIGGVLIVVNKLVEAVVELGKEAAKAFTAFIKGSVETSKSIEVTDRLLGSLTGNIDMGPAFRDFLLGESFRVGIDLTEDFARALVPLSKNTEQITRAAEQAGILAHAFQQTEEAVARAYKQMTAGHSRPFQQLFGITPTEIDRIQELQEEFGELEGVILGMEEALEFRGLDMNAIEGSLQLLQGRFNVLRKVMENTVGTPVKDALAEQLEELFKLIDDEGTAIKSVFRTIGDGVADVINKVGELARSLIGDVSTEDVMGFKTAIDTLTDDITDLVDQFSELLGMDDRGLVETLTAVIEKLSEVTQHVDAYIEFLDKLQYLSDWEFGDLLPELGLPKWSLTQSAGRLIMGDPLELLASVKGLAEDAYDVFTDAWESESLEPFETKGAAAYLAFADGFLTSLPFGIGEMVRGAQDIAEFIRPEDAIDPDFGDLQDYWMREHAKIKIPFEYEKADDAIMDLSEEWEKYLEAVEKVIDAHKKLDLDFLQKMEEMQIEFDREDLDQRIQEAQDFEDLYREHGHELEELTYDRLNDEDAAIRSFNRKNQNAFTKYNDKLIDIHRKSVNKKADIEQKYREKLEDIRRRFDLDAEEAIRRNDAVALLRIRRRMKAEMEEAKINKDRQIAEEDDRIAQEEENAKIAYQRQLRDNQTFLTQKQEDIDIADQQKREEMQRQLNWEKKTLELEHKRQRKIMAEERKRAQEDLELDYKHRLEQMDLQFEEEYKIVEDWKKKETQVLADALKRQTAILDYTYRTWRSRLQSLGSLGTMIHNLLGMGSSMLGGITAGDDPFAGLGLGTLFGGGGIGGRLIPAATPYIDPYRSPGEPMQHGGYVTPGNIYGVNERGVEAFMATRAGIILPHQAMMLSPPDRAGATSIDNSRHLNADVSLLSPDQLTPIVRTEVRSLLTDEILRIGF